MNAVTVLAPAKVNLRLEVCARRSDGFHDLDTWMMALDFGDRLSLEIDGPSDRNGGEASVALHLEGDFASSDIPSGGDNLVLRALACARERARELGRIEASDVPLALRLWKGIPSQSGLGGASSDASAVLEAFEKVFRIDLGAGWRNATLGTLGSDCVFFEEARNYSVVRCEGRGERVVERVLSTPPWFVAVVTPEARCPTPAVFGALEFPLSAPPQIPTVQEDMFTEPARSARLWSFNHLESAAAQSIPEIARWRSLLDSTTKIPFVMSGSGSSFFGLFDERESAECALDDVRTEALKNGIGVRGTWVARARHHG